MGITINWEAYPCVICGKLFKRKKKLSRSRRVCKGIRGLGTVTCSKECSKLHRRKQIK